ETDLEGSGISGSVPGYTSQMDWFGTVRGRVGYAFDRALVYATGGFAYGNVTNTGWPSETQTGWVVGAGVEYKITPSWSAKVEYQYMDLDATDPTGAGRLGDASLGQTEVSTVRVGVNYFVGGIYEPLK
ncbi:MAG: outer membrane beta-barrel protein, partial [Rhodomicrobium sp.]